MKLDTVANVVTIVAGITLCVVLVQRFREPKPPVPGPPYQINDDLSATIPVEFNNAPRTVMLVLQTHCPYCNASMNFYRSLLDERNRRQSKTRIVVLSDTTDSEMDGHLEAERVHPDSITHVAGLWKHVPETPTILVADARGKLVKVWESQLTSDLEKEVRHYVLSN